MSEALLLFCVEVEVGRTLNDPLPADSGGAFVNVYLAAPDIRTALNWAESCLTRDGYRIHSLEAVFNVDLDEYIKDPEAEGEPEYEDLLTLLDHGGAWYGAFHCYPPEEAPQRLH